jgi:hypothetical protein
MNLATTPVKKKRKRRRRRRKLRYLRQRLENAKGKEREELIARMRRITRHPVHSVTKADAMSILPQARNDG